MSLVATYVKADDGFFYNCPILSGEGWFICFDDDEPPELVIAKDSEVKFENVFKKLGIDYNKIKERKMGGERFFDGEFKEALSYFFKLRKPIPSKYITKNDGKIKSIKEIYQGVIYDPTKGKEI